MKPLGKGTVTRGLSAIALFGMLAAPAAWGQGNSTNAHWIVDHIAPGELRGKLVSAGAQGTPVIPTATPTATNTPTPTETSVPYDCTGKTDGMTCDAGVVDLGSTLICVAGQCVACVPDGNGLQTRFVDNGNGTITDLHTCLVWEKKDDSGSIHDKDNTYTWSTCTDPSCPPDGTAFTVFLATLNGSSFAGHSDWRMPTSAGASDQPPCYICDNYPTNDPPEIESLISFAPVCPPGAPSPDIPPCVFVYPEFATNCGDPWLPGNEGCTIDGAGETEECSCTGIPSQNVAYWSFSRAAYAAFDSDSVVWGIDAWNPFVLGFAIKDPYGSDVYSNAVRAVRGGAVVIP